MAISLILTIFSCLLAAIVQSTLASIESFPSCVEITVVDPPPYSVVKHHNYRTTFYITFSKPVKMVNDDYENIVLSSSPRPRPVQGQPGIHPVTVKPHSPIFPLGTRRKWRADFTFKNWRTREPLFRVFYLIVEGAFFYTYDYSQRKIYVPFTSIGPYYIDQREKEHHGNISTHSLLPSPYCTPRQRRDRAHRTAKGVESFLQAKIPQRGHYMTADDLSTVQLFALVNVTEGKGTVTLPPFVTVNVSGVEHDVELPAWNLTFDLPFTKWEGDVTQTVIIEPIERIYHSLAPAYAATHSRDLNLFHRLSKEQPLSEPYYVHKKRWGREGYELFAWPSGPKIMEFQKLSLYGNWVERVQSGKFYHQSDKKALPVPHSTYLLSRKLLITAAKQCPVDSPRNPGRQGHVFHAIEYGPYYQVLEFPRPWHWWIRYYRSGEESGYKSVIATTEKGEVKDLSSKAQFGWKNKGISSRIVKAITEDYVCLQTALTWTYWGMRFNLDDGCIFVPKETALSKECGGLSLYQNLKSITDAPDFCSREFGDCIGRSFYSTERFPVVPPFGLPEISGSVSSWEKNGKARRVVNMELWSPLNQVDVHHIPITGAKLLFPHVEFTEKGFCSTLWRLDSEGTIPSATLSAHIHNAGKGGGVFEVGLECTAELLVFPSSNITIKIEKKSEAVVKFSLSGSEVLHQPTAHHTCKMTLAIKTVKELSSQVQKFPDCSTSITTYHGLFKNPCTLKGRGLPDVDMKYYDLPVDQMEPLAREHSVQNRANLQNERKLQLVKAITISLGVQGHQQHLISNLKQLHVYCGRPDILITRTYGEYLVHQAVAGLTGADSGPPEPSLVFSGDDINLNTAYFFMPTRDLEEPVYTDCWAELWANKPHPLCDNPVLVAYTAIPLRDHDVAVFEGEEDILAVLYGPTTEGVRMLLLISIVAGVVLCILGSIMHTVLLIVRKFLPQRNTLKQYRKDLQKAKEEDADYWENPLMFLCDGQHGPFYKLHDLRATCPLDSEKSIKSLKIAGTLRYEDKELQVLFGHVKKVFVEKTAKTVWVQASSGMYQLCPDQVSLKYRDEYTALMKRQGVKIKLHDFEPELKTPP